MRSTGSRNTPPRLWRASVDDGRAESFDIGDLDITPSRVGVHPNYMFVELEWAGPGEVIFKATRGKENPQARRDWWLPERAGKTQNLTDGLPSVQAVFNQVGSRSGRSVLVGVDRGELWQVDAAGRRLINLTEHFDPLIAEVADPSTGDSRPFSWPRTRHDSRVATEPFSADDQDQRGDGIHLILLVAEGNSRSQSYFLFDVNSSETVRLEKPAANAALTGFAPGANTAAGTTSCPHATRFAAATFPTKPLATATRVHSARAAQLFPELALARADRSFSHLLRRLAQADVLVLGLGRPLSATNPSDSPLQPSKFSGRARRR